MTRYMFAQHCRLGMQVKNGKTCIANGKHIKLFLRSVSWCPYFPPHISAASCCMCYLTMYMYDLCIVLSPDSVLTIRSLVILKRKPLLTS